MGRTARAVFISLVCKRATTKQQLQEMRGSKFVQSDLGNIFQELFEKVRDNLDYRLSNTAQCWQANLEAPTQKSEQRDVFWNDYQKKGIDFVIKKYGTVPMKTKVKNKLLKILRGGGTN